MEEHNKFEEASEILQQYLNTRYELLVLQTTEKIANVGADAVSTTIILKLTSISILILSLAAAFYISFIMGDTYTGFFIVGGAYFLIALFFIGFRKSALIKPFRNIIIRSMLKQHN